MGHRVRLGVTALLCIAVTGCASRERAARDTLAQAFACPVERVTATKIDGVRWSEVMRRATPVPDPPAEVRSDPARLAQWTEQYHAPFSPGFDHNYAGFRAAGCGHAVDYLCFCPFDAPAWKQAACHCEAPTVALLSGLRDRAPR